VGGKLSEYVVTQVNISLDDGEHERLKEWKDERGMTWADVLFHDVEVDE
jgi:hypothetical protein